MLHYGNCEEATSINLENKLENVMGIPYVVIQIWYTQSCVKYGSIYSLSKYIPNIYFSSQIVLVKNDP